MPIQSRNQLLPLFGSRWDFNCPLSIEHGGNGFPFLIVFLLKIRANATATQKVDHRRDDSERLYLDRTLLVRALKCDRLHKHMPYSTYRYTERSNSLASDMETGCAPGVS